jgi:hypothetical protein
VPAKPAAADCTADYLRDGNQGVDIDAALKNLRTKRVYCIADDGKSSGGRLDADNWVLRLGPAGAGVADAP